MGGASDPPSGGAMPKGVSIRRATAADLEQIYDIFYANEVGDDPDPPPRGEVPPWLEHSLATGEMHLAERGGRVVGFAGRLVHGPVAYLTDLFVLPEEQSGGIGKRLLERALPEDGTIRCTLSSRDHRALALYVRAGMRPWWPNLWLRAHTPRLGEVPREDVRVVEARAGDPELVRWDAAVSGRSRPVEHDYWIGLGAIPVWFERGGERVGYGYVQTRSPSALSFREAYALGPIGARDEADALGCVCAAVEFARPRAEVIRLSIPGPHPALPALLAAGFRITYVETFVSTAAEPFLDPRRYIGSGDFL